MSQSSQFKAMDSYFSALLSEPGKAPAEPQSTAPVFAEPAAQQEKLAELLASVEPEVAVTTQSVQSVTPHPGLAHGVLKAPEPPAPPKWQNIVTEREFQALFFIVSGVTFAVPLTELGGIHQLAKINTLFGKPDWFAGVMTQRESQLNVVDTTRWIMPGKQSPEPYNYLVMLGNSVWGLACHQLIGTELLHRDRIQWRSSAGHRPWLAGMVKEKMCALLHVQELLTLLERGVNIDGC
ncbi:MAG: chemotaxis protein CheW [Aeromonadaceae bacterium]